MFYYLLTTAYDGTDFAGWAKQKNKKTIQGEIEKAFEKVAPNSKFRMVGASKTDSGVHAKDQKVWTELSFEPNVSGFLLAINKTLPIGIKILKMEKIEKEYRVRNCKYKIYMYSIKFNNLDISNNRFSYFSKRILDLNKLKKALKCFEGKHNFINYSGLNEAEAKEINPNRSVDKIWVKKSNDGYQIFFKAKGFIRYQIRMMMGATIAFANNKIDLNKIINVLNLKDKKMPYKAESCGLTLLKIVNN
ncbi:tRNA pseudouridine synthase A [Spiroplasma litorale]|uniref:tRNA pseudouridine synthase A n=1 Tax=Spiroplasma litorale TaxID=216942 RepID=A0A0K1W399_9MOLU|nr:tRNA pseudouridine(38-40) synthase TruA [Spiroplasma litorale]AKX34582.1 tRNA pseudouridine synthase A [Spiroplasma litorale]